MLLQFAVANYRSFHEEALLNLIPAKSRTHPKHVLLSEDAGRKVQALPLAVLYGANAAGKSNLIRAVAFARTLIVYGTRSEEPTGIQPFRLDPACASEPSRFEFVFKFEDIVYTYGFATTSDEVREEWLYAVFHKQDVRLFERETDGSRARVKIGDKLANLSVGRQRLEFVAAGTRPNQLFLTEAVDRNVRALLSPMRWFRDHLRVVFPDSRYAGLIPRAHAEPEFARYLAQFLQEADTGVSDVRLSSFKAGLFLDSLPPEARDAFLDRLPKEPGQLVVLDEDQSLLAHLDENRNTRLMTLHLEHTRTDGTKVSFSIRDESDGTRRLMNLAPALFDSESRPDVYLIDELDRSLHPLLSRYFLEKFLLGIEERGQKSQIVLTTHDSTLLDLDLLRKDEVWFVEKDPVGASSLVSLVEFREKARQEHNTSNRYLMGRYGGIPIVRQRGNLF